MREPTKSGAAPASGDLRLSRFLSQAGVASRRHADELIESGRVHVNGKPVTALGSKIDPHRDRVAVDGKRVEAQAHRYLALCKPKGYVTTRNDPQGRQTVMELLGPRHANLYPVGRLDFHTDGVILLTNDGELAHALMHPSGEVLKTYHAKLVGDVGAEQIEALREGVVLDDGARTGAAEVMLITSNGKHTWLQIGIRQGLNRQIHRMGEAIGHRVEKLSRVAYGPISSEGLRPGEWRELEDEEVDALRKLAGLSRRPASRDERRGPPERGPRMPFKGKGKGKTSDERPAKAATSALPAKPARPVAKPSSRTSPRRAPPKRGGSSAPRRPR